MDDITQDLEFKDLHKFWLSRSDWTILKEYQEILQVIIVLVFPSFRLIENYQVPHAFQDILGAETTPTLCYSISAFTAFIQLWKQLATEWPDWKVLIHSGLDKLADYQDQLPDTPAYTVAMGKVLCDNYVHLF